MEVRLVNNMSARRVYLSEMIYLLYFAVMFGARAAGLL